MGDHHLIPVEAHHRGSGSPPHGEAEVHHLCLFLLTLVVVPNSISSMISGVLRVIMAPLLHTFARQDLVSQQLQASYC